MAPASAKFIEFSATTWMSGVDIGTEKFEKVRVELGARIARRPARISSNRRRFALRSTIARSSGTPLGLVEGDRILGVIHLKDVVKPDVRDRFNALRRMGIKTVMITGDNPGDGRCDCLGGGRR